GAVMLGGERLAETPGALSALARLASASGASLAWVPRGRGERGAVEAGARPGLLPAGRPVSDPAARAEVARAWGVAALPGEPGRDCGQILAAALSGDLDALVVADVDPADLPDERAALAALEAAPFVVSLELRTSAVTDRADVVLPVAAVPEKAGTFLNWEGRPAPLGVARGARGGESARVVRGRTAEEMDAPLGRPAAAAARRELGTLAGWQGTRTPVPQDPPAARVLPGPGEAVLA